MDNENFDSIEKIAQAIEVSDHCYALAERRYHSIAEHLNAEDSAVAKFEPQIYPQGSFAIGTAIRPLGEKEEYDVDLVCEVLGLDKTLLNQEALRKLIGGELLLYTQENGMNEKPENRRRCWTLHYVGSPSFHVDVLPSLPEDQATIVGIANNSVEPHLAQKAIALTDRDHHNYRKVSFDWPSSNPSGYADWFRERMKPLVTFREEKSIAAIPVYRIKTPLQRTVQLLKRHCRSYFFEDPTYMPISMIITTLAAMLYDGERSVGEAFAMIVPRLANSIDRENPYLPNPVNPKENFADKWTRDDNYYQKFQEWCARLNDDWQLISGGNFEQRSLVARKSFRVGKAVASVGMPSVHLRPSRVATPSGQKPWCR